jgi:hypothetical protein
MSFDIAENGTGELDHRHPSDRYKLRFPRFDGQRFLAQPSDQQWKEPYHPLFKQLRLPMYY